MRAQESDGQPAAPRSIDELKKRVAAILADEHIPGAGIEGKLALNAKLKDIAPEVAVQNRWDRCARSIGTASIVRVVRACNRVYE